MILLLLALASFSAGILVAALVAILAWRLEQDCCEHANIHQIENGYQR